MHLQIYCGTLGGFDLLNLIAFFAGVFCNTLAKWADKLF
jgi:hypothetical protein